jgi:RHS repeat-associated protein
VNRPLGVNTAYAYDASGRLTSLVHSGGTSLLSFDYAYDRAGNRLAKTDPAGSHTFVYDELYRLTQASAPVGGPQERYAYDANTNRVGSHLSAAYTYDVAGRLTADATFDYSYDANGNLIRRVERTTGAITTYSYDPDDQLIRIDFPGGTNAVYRYDGLGRRISKTIGTQVTRYIYDDDDIVLEYAGATLAARYTHGPAVDDVLSASRGGVTSHVQSDALGSVVRTLAASGSTSSYTYDGYGRIVSQTGSAVSPYSYTGREYDPESNLYYYRSRYYSPDVGRFLTEDPAGFTAGNNSYGYVGANPINFTDPTGECPWCVAGIIGGLTDLGIQLAFNGFNFKCVNWTEVGVSAAASAAGVGLAQKLAQLGKLGKVSTQFGGPNRPTYRFFQSKGVARVESHPIRSSHPNWLSYPHWHADFAGKPWSKMHLPVVEPAVGVPAAAHNAMKGDCECK